ncbi:MAG: YibE/F family protein [Dehalococcoidia bacterium]
MLDYAHGVGRIGRGPRPASTPEVPMNPASSKRSTLLVVGGLCLALIVITAIIPASGLFNVQIRRGVDEQMGKGAVRRVVSEETIRTARNEILVQQLEVALGGQVVVVEHSRTSLDAGIGRTSPGDQVLIGRTVAEDGVRYYVADYVRDTPLIALSAAFVALVLLVGRRQGLWSLAGMAASLVVIVRFIVPGIVAGFNPVAISCIGAIAIMLPTLYLAHGINRKSTVALAGVGASLACTAILASLSIAIARLSGAASEAATVVRSMSEGRITAEGLLLAGIIIGALGILDDVTVGQASTVFELRRANARLSRLELYRRGMNVGRDHIASTVNTLLLAYAGASLPLLILLANQTDSLGVLLSREFMATEVIRTLVGSIGIVLAVPVTTALAALVAGRVPADTRDAPPPAAGVALPAARQARPRQGD